MDSHGDVRDESDFYVFRLAAVTIIKLYDDLRKCEIDGKTVQVFCSEPTQYKRLVGFTANGDPQVESVADTFEASMEDAASSGEPGDHGDLWTSPFPLTSSRLLAKNTALYQRSNKRNV